MKSLFLLLTLFSAMAFAAPPQATVSWNSPTLNTDGTTITGALTFNLYMGGQGVVPLTAVAQKGIIPSTFVVTTGLVAGTTICFAVTAVVATIESAQTAPGCVTIPQPVPGVPTQVTVVLH